MTKTGHQPGALLRRRDFLALGAAYGTSALFLGPAEAEGQAAVRPVLPMPVGYVEGSDLLPDLKRLPRLLRALAPAELDEEEPELRAVPAAEVPLGDTSLIGSPLRCRIGGLYPGAAAAPRRRRELPRAIDLDVLFPSADPLFPEPLRFFAWTLRRPPWKASPPVSFRFPLDWEVLPELVMTVTAADGTRTTYHTRFTLDQEQGRPRLQRGLYLLGFAPSAWRSDLDLRSLDRDAPAERFSLLFSLEPEPPETGA